MLQPTATQLRQKTLRLCAHRVTLDDRIACHATGTIPEIGDMVFKCTSRGREIFFRTVKIAEGWAKDNQEAL